MTRQKAPSLSGRAPRLPRIHGSRLVVWAALLAVALVIVGCSSAGTKSGSANTAAVTLRMNFTPVGDQAYYFYADETGAFQRNGLDVSIEDGKGSLPTAQDVANGGATFGVVASISAATAIAKGADLISIANPVSRSSWGLIVPTNSEIKTIADMPGHTVLVSAGSPETVFLPAAFERNGVNPKDVTERNVDPAAKFSSYIQKMGDAVGTSATSIVPLMAEKRPSRAVLFADNGVPFPDYSIVVRQETIKQKPKVVAGFLRAVFDAQQKAIEDPETVAAALVKARPNAGDQKLFEAQLKYAEEFYCTPSQDGTPYGYQVEKDWEKALELLKKYGGVSGDLNVDNFITNQFLTGDNPVSKAKCGA